VTHRIVRMLAAANRSTVARTRWWLKVFTFRHCVNCLRHESRETAASVSYRVACNQCAADWPVFRVDHAVDPGGCPTRCSRWKRVACAMLHGCPLTGGCSFGGGDISVHRYRGIDPSAGNRR
jgi:hypothetical protein